MSTTILSFREACDILAKEEVKKVKESPTGRMYDEIYYDRLHESYRITYSKKSSLRLEELLSGKLFRGCLVIVELGDDEGGSGVRLRPTCPVPLIGDKNVKS